MFHIKLFTLESTLRSGIFQKVRLDFLMLEVRESFATSEGYSTLVYFLIKALGGHIGDRTYVDYLWGYENSYTRRLSS